MAIILHFDQSWSVQRSGVSIDVGGLYRFLRVLQPGEISLEDPGCICGCYMLVLKPSTTIKQEDGMASMGRRSLRLTLRR